jgi:hypothetical protein
MQTLPAGGEGLRGAMCANPHAECQECPRGGAQAALALLSSNLPIPLCYSSYGQGASHFCASSGIVSGFFLGESASDPENLP